jgi:Flp pilus assembly protein TadG
MRTFRRFSRRLQVTNGQALVEFVLVLPLLFLLILNAVNFGGLFYAWITVSNAARAGADYAVLGGASAGAPGTPSATQINNVIKAEISSLPNATSLVVDVCQRYNTTTTTLLGTCTSIPADPETTSFTLTTIDVTYTYQPFISGFTFPKLGIFLTTPPTTVYQRAEMRSLN